MKKLLLFFLAVSAYAQVSSTNGTIGNTIPGTVGTGGGGGQQPKRRIPSSPKRTSAR